jgi:chromosome segregation ATPase
MSCYTPEQRREIMARARAILAETAPAVQRGAVVPRATGPKLVFKTKVQTEPRESARSTEAAESSKTSVVARANSEQSWWEWVDARMEHRLHEYSKAVGQVIGTKARDVRDQLEEGDAAIRREFELLQREFRVLQKEVALERGLKALREEVETARAEVPKLPAIAAQFDAEQKQLRAKQASLERELAKTKDRLGKVRVDQSITDYRLRELQKQAKASGEASIEMEFETKSSRFAMKAVHPDAARALKDFAGQIIDGQRDGTLWLPGRAGNA